MSIFERSSLYPFGGSEMYSSQFSALFSSYPCLQRSAHEATSDNANFDFFAHLYFSFQPSIVPFSSSSSESRVRLSVAYAHATNTNQRNTAAAKATTAAADTDARHETSQTFRM